MIVVFHAWGGDTHTEENVANLWDEQSMDFYTLKMMDGKTKQIPKLNYDKVDADTAYKKQPKGFNFFSCSEGELK